MVIILFTPFVQVEQGFRTISKRPTNWKDLPSHVVAIQGLGFWVDRRQYKSALNPKNMHSP